MGTGLSRSEDRDAALFRYPLICPGGTSARASANGEVRHYDETLCEHPPWLVKLASQKRKTVTEMRDIMEPHIDALVRSALLHYTGWLSVLLNKSGTLPVPLDAEALVVTFLRQVDEVDVHAD